MSTTCTLITRNIQISLILFSIIQIITSSFIQIIRIYFRIFSIIRINII